MPRLRLAVILPQPPQRTREDGGRVAGVGGPYIRVRFNRDVRNCAYSATPSFDGAGFPGPIKVWQDGLDSFALKVRSAGNQTTDGHFEYAPATLDFHLIVFY